MPNVGAPKGRQSRVHGLNAQIRDLVTKSLNDVEKHFLI